MAKQVRFKRLFEGVKFKSVGEVLSHADEISRKIPVKKRKPIKLKPLSAFHRQVLELAPRFLHGQYKEKAIANELLAMQGVPQPSARQFAETYQKVKLAMLILRRRNLVTLTTTQDRQLLPTLRRVSSKDIQKDEGLIHTFIRSGVGKFARDWRRFLTYEEAVAVGRRGLQSALETHDSAKGALATHAFYRIAGEISREVRKRRRVALRERSLSQVDRSGRKLEERIGSAAVNPEALQTQLHNLFEHPKVEQHRLVLWTLYKVYGHSAPELARHLGVTASAVTASLRKLKKLTPHEGG